MSKHLSRSILKTFELKFSELLGPTWLIDMNEGICHRLACSKRRATAVPNSNEIVISI